MYPQMNKMNVRKKALAKSMKGAGPMPMPKKKPEGLMVAIGLDGENEMPGEMEGQEGEAGMQPMMLTQDEMEMIQEMRNSKKGQMPGMEMEEQPGMNEGMMG